MRMQSFIISALGCHRCRSTQLCLCHLALLLSTRLRQTLPAQATLSRSVLYGLSVQANVTDQRSWLRSTGEWDEQQNQAGQNSQRNQGRVSLGLEVACNA